MKIDKYRDAVESLSTQIYAYVSSVDGSTDQRNAEILIKANGMEVARLGREFRATGRAPRKPTTQAPTPVNPDVDLALKAGKKATA